MGKVQHRQIYILVLCGVTLAVCVALRMRDTTPPSLPLAGNSPESLGIDAKAIYARADLRYPVAYLLKPDHKREGSSEFSLAPLLLQRVAAVTGESLDRHLFGAVTSTAAGEVTVDPSQPTIYFSESTAVLRGKEYRQLSYQWWYPRSTGGRSQGFRMTLDDSGLLLLTLVGECCRD